MTAQVKTDMHFAMIPEWLLEHEEISHAAIRLYCVLARYADANDGRAYPSRKTLAKRLGVKSADTVDRALKDLVAVGAVTVTKRYDEAGDPTSSLYIVHKYPPEGVAARMRPPTRTDAATGPQGCGEGGRTDAAQNENHLKKEPPIPPPAGGDEPDATTTPDPSTTCARPGPAPHANCRGCGTTNRQIQRAQKRAAAERRRQAEQDRIEAQRAEAERIRTRPRSPTTDQLLNDTRRVLATARSTP